MPEQTELIGLSSIQVERCPRIPGLQKETRQDRHNNSTQQHQIRMRQQQSRQEDLGHRSKERYLTPHEAQDLPNRLFAQPQEKRMLILATIESLIQACDLGGDPQINKAEQPSFELLIDPGIQDRQHRSQQHNSRNQRRRQSDPIDKPSISLTTNRTDHSTQEIIVDKGQYGDGDQNDQTDQRQRTLANEELPRQRAVCVCHGSEISHLASKPGSDSTHCITTKLKHNSPHLIFSRTRSRLVHDTYRALNLQTGSELVI